MRPPISSRLAFTGGLAAFVGGLLVWRVLFGIALQLRPVPPDSLVEAREIGLISFTVLNNYDIGQEPLAWLLGCLVVPLCLWTVLSNLLPSPGGLTRPGRRRSGQDRREGDDRRATSREEESTASDRRGLDRRGAPSWAPWLALTATFAGVTLRPSLWRGANPWGSFGLLGEEGVYLGAVQAIRSGRRLYADLEFPYGPLLIEPLNLWLRLAGDDVVASRIYVALLHGLGLVVVALTLRALLGPKRGPWVGLGAALTLALIGPLFLPLLNSVLLRTTLPFLPAALVLAGSRRLEYRHGEGEDALDAIWACPLAAAGAITAVACFFSFDSGVAALAGLGLSLLLVGAGPAIWGRVALAVAAPSTLVLTFLLIGGNLGAFVEQAQRMLHLPAVGYQALPYPDVFGLFVDSRGQAGSYPPMNPATDTWSNAAALWATIPPLLIWLGLGLGLRAPRAGGRATRNAGLLSMAVVAAILFRAALGRSDLYHLWFYGAVPVVLIGSLLFERIWEHCNRELRLALALVTCLGIAGILRLSPESEVRFPESEEVRLAKTAGIKGDPLDPRTVDFERLGDVELLPRLAVQVQVMLHRVSELDERDGVYFFPSEAAYYYLTDRPLPLRYLWAYDAATPEMQAEAIAELERSQPRWLFRSTDTFAIDHIPQTHLMPRLDTYLKDNYRLVEVLTGATLHERVER